MDTKGDMPQCLYNPGVRIKRVVWKNVTDTFFIDKKTKADIFTATVASSFQRNLTIIRYSLGVKLLLSIVLKHDKGVRLYFFSPIQDYVHPDDHTQPTYEMTPGFKPFTVLL